MKAAEKPATVSRYNTLIDSSPIRQKFSALQPLKYRCLMFIHSNSSEKRFSTTQHFTDFQIQSHPGNHNVPRPETHTNPFTLTVNRSWVGLERTATSRPILGQSRSLYQRTKSKPGTEQLRLANSAPKLNEGR